jgi:hypothetical protein
MKRRTQVTATMLDADGYPFVVFKGTPQDVADAASIYVLNIANPLGGEEPLIDLIESREDTEGDD